MFMQQAHDKLGEQGGDGSKTNKAAHPNQGAKQRGGGWPHTTPPPVEGNWWQHYVEGSLKDLAKAMGVSREIIRNRDKAETLWVLPIHTKQYQVWFQTKVEYDKVQSKMPKEPKST